LNSGLHTGAAIALTFCKEMMATIFTKAKAAKKVIDLMERQFGIKRKKLQCDSQLESDLGIVGDDTYVLLEILNMELGVDISGFDCDDHITPEGIPPLHMLCSVVITLVTIALMIATVPATPKWIMIVISLLGPFTTTWVISKLFTKPHPELRVRDLVLSVEAGCWVSPKAEQDMVGNR
jgi:hypothetical protein